ncbi:MAG: hypothetical protein RR945_01985 [Erysipelotrichaceae bacterium]
MENKNIETEIDDIILSLCELLKTQIKKANEDIRVDLLGTTRSLAILLEHKTNRCFP